MSIAIYLRVSKGRGQDTASQKPDLKRWAAAQAEPATWYEDRMTGKLMARPQLDKLLVEVRARKVGAIAVWRLDRLGRTASGLTALFDELLGLGANLVSLRDGFNLTTPAGRLQANILASVAAYETEIRAERIHAGLEVARAAGKHLGRAKGSGLGRRLKVTDEAEAIVRRLKAEGQPVAWIARATGLARQTVYTILAENQPAIGKS